MNEPPDPPPDQLQAHCKSRGSGLRWYFQLGELLKKANAETIAKLVKTKVITKGDVSRSQKFATFYDKKGVNNLVKKKVKWACVRSLLSFDNPTERREIEDELVKNHWSSRELQSNLKARGLLQPRGFASPKPWPEGTALEQIRFLGSEWDRLERQLQPGFTAIAKKTIMEKDTQAARDILNRVKEGLERMMNSVSDLLKSGPRKPKK